MTDIGGLTLTVPTAPMPDGPGTAGPAAPAIVVAVVDDELALLPLLLELLLESFLCLSEKVKCPENGLEHDEEEEAETIVTVVVVVVVVVEQMVGDEVREVGDPDRNGGERGGESEGRNLGEDGGDSDILRLLMMFAVLERKLL